MERAPLIAVTDHAVERYLQRVRGTLEPRTEIMTRVSRGMEAGLAEPEERGHLLVRDRTLVFVCVHDRPRGELVVITCWEDGPQAAVPRRYTDALRRLDRRSGRPSGR